MELKEFIKETLLQIVIGVKDAQEASAKYGAAINPAIIKKGDVMTTRIGDEDRTVQNVSFEVALASSSGESVNKGVGVMLASIGAGINKNKDDKSSTTTGIKFTIPVVLPSTDNNNSPVDVSKKLSTIGHTNKHRY